MRFHVTQTHTPESCPLAHSSESRVRDWRARAEEVGVDLIAAVGNQVGHTLYFIVETDDIIKLQELFRPMLGFARADVTPVRDLINPQ